MTCHSNTQAQRLKKHFERGFSITRLGAFNELGIVELSARIIDLERQGYEISRTRIQVNNRFGESVRVMKYKKKEL